MSFIQKFDVAGTRQRLEEQIADYDRVMRGEELNEYQQRSLRTLAQVFDLDVEGLTSAGLWARLRPLVADRDDLWRNDRAIISYKIDSHYID